MGLFITMEGPDGSGKTLQMDLLQNYLLEQGYDVLRTREPGGPPVAEKIRELLLDPENKAMCARAEALLYAASRAQHVEETVKPALEAGKIVLCDRFTDSSLVYQGMGRGLGVEEVAALSRFATDSLEPDVTVLLQIDAAEGIRRKQKQTSGKLDRMEMEKAEFHRRVHDGFDRLAELFPDRIRTVNAIGTPEEVHLRVREAVRPFLTA